MVWDMWGHLSCVICSGGVPEAVWVLVVRESELGENDVAIVRVLWCQVAQDDRVEQTNDVRHDDLDDRGGVEARGERAALDASPHRVNERFPVLLR